MEILVLGYNLSVNLEQINQNKIGMSCLCAMTLNSNSKR